MPTPLESKEGSSPVCVRSVAAALRGEFLDIYRIPRWQRHALSALSFLGGDAIRRTLALSQRFMGVPARAADLLRIEALAKEHTDLYLGEERFDTVLLGAPSGGAAQLANVLRAPFLSQHFVVSFAERCHPDDLRTYAAHGATLARRLLRHNPQLSVINHYDPLHDRWLVGAVNHLRMKLLTLPEAYRRFLKERLMPGGTILFLDCTSRWRHYRLGPRHTLQVGGLGGASEQDFLEGRPEIFEMQRRERSSFVGPWRLEAPLEEQPESEWGSLPELGGVLEEYARKSGYQFVRLAGPHPEWFSSLALRAFLRLYEKDGAPARGTLIEMFTNVQPSVVRRARLLPLWLPWNCTDSLAFLQRMRPSLVAPALFLLLSNFCLTFDLVSWREWSEALQGLSPHFLGQREELFPSDPVGLWAGGEALWEWSQRNVSPVTERLSAEELSKLAERLS